MNKLPLHAFISYSHVDDAFRAQLEIHLAVLKREGVINTWSDRRIGPGQKWEEEIDENLEGAQLVFLLVSPDFLASEYCYEKEMRYAIKKNDLGELILIPIIIRHSAWRESPLANFQALPHDAKPIAAWRDPDEAWLDVVTSITEISRADERIGSTLGTKVRDAVEGAAFKVGVFGLTGVGESTLCNALLEREVMRISDLVPQTRHVQVASARLGSLTLEYYDCPGLGEAQELDEEYRKVYQNVLNIIDMTLWVVRADVRFLREDTKYVNGPLKPFIFGLDSRHFLLIMNMVDRIDPTKNWDSKHRRPGKNQQLQIDRKTMYLSGALKLSPGSILPVSSRFSYNIDELQRRIAKYTASKYVT